MNPDRPEDLWNALAEEKERADSPPTKGEVVPYDLLQRYLYEVNWHPLLGPEEENTHYLHKKYTN